MENKPKIEDACLTIEQAIELQALGFELKYTMMVYCDFNDQKHEYELVINRKGVEVGVVDIIPTLTNTEMFNILEFLSKNDKTWDFDLSLNNFDVFLDAIKYDMIFTQKIFNESRHFNHISKNNLRDALFETLKCLITNKII